MKNTKTNVVILLQIQIGNLRKLARWEKESNGRTEHYDRLMEEASAKEHTVFLLTNQRFFDEISEIFKHELKEKIND